MPKIVHHLNYFMGPMGVFYCEFLNQVITGDTQAHHDKHCLKCPFFVGHLQGEGVECDYVDSTADESIVTVDDPGEFERKRRPAWKKDRDVYLECIEKPDSK
jgi:hypothetical protein